MRHHFMRHWLAALALIASLSLDATLSDAIQDLNEVAASASIAVDASVNNYSANVAVDADDNSKRTQSFVTATHGSAYALTLTTYLTDAAHLHYAVLSAGQSALDAVEIKNAAAQCVDDVASVEVRTDQRFESVQSLGLVAADTITVAKAQKVERTVQNLLPNTSYDVYFVAEVIGSNGVFGPVQSVLQSFTHSEPPVLDIIAVRPGDASADTVHISASLTTPGRAYFALIPSKSSYDDVDIVLSRDDLVKNRTDDVRSRFALHSHVLGPNDSCEFQKVVEGLTPATLYDVFAMTEASGHGEVRSDVVHRLKSVRTHALAPEVTSLTCSPLNASATALRISYQLDVKQEDIERITIETLSYFSYNLHYEVIALSDGSASQRQATVTSGPSSSTSTAATRSTEDISVLKNTTVRGIVSVGNFSSVDDILVGLKDLHHANITGLQSGTLYKVKLRGETAGSNGLFGLCELTAQAKTHEAAPKLLAVGAQATNQSVHSLTLTIDLERPKGDIHYVLAWKTGAIRNLRSVFQQATGIDNLKHLLRDRFPQDFDEKDYTMGVFKFTSDELASFDHVAIPSANAYAEVQPGQTTDDHTQEAFQQQFEIKGLKDGTLYAIALVPETTRSFGLFGDTFATLLETATNEKASEVDLRSARALYANVTAIELEVSMTKPHDVLFLCLDVATIPSEVLDIDHTTDRSSRSCREVEDRTSFVFSGSSSNLFTFIVGGLREDEVYRVSLYAENARRNGVLSDRSAEVSVRTHKSAPHVLESFAQPAAASTSKIDVQVVVAPDSPCILHYVVRKALDFEEEREPVDAGTIIEHSSKDTRSHRLSALSSSSFVDGGNVFTGTTATTTFAIDGLSANTSYDVIVVTETSRDGNRSGVLGTPVLFNATTHAVAPTIVLATVDPVAGSTDSIIICANLSHPGVVHYFVSDVDFADPAIISHGDCKRTPHELRGQLQVLEEHLLMEVINGTNDTRPTAPRTFVHNTTVNGLKSGVTYHVSLTTETRGSDGVFGEFPPPVLVNTHLGPPNIIADTLSVHAVDGSSSALTIDFQLDRFGDVHYALFFRGLVPDRSQDFGQVQDRPEKTRAESLSTEDGGNESIPIWPPPVSTFDLAQLNGSMLKAADFEDLGMGVWENGTILVSREDVARGKLTTKEIDKLPANAVFDVCLVTETAASGGVLGWPSDGSATACHRVVTHADYTNQSRLFDEIAVHALGGRTDGIRINLNVSKLLKAAQTTDATDDTVGNHFARTIGRMPYFVLIDATSRHASGLAAIVSHQGEVTRAFKDATPGRGDGVVAAGMLTNILGENDTALELEHDLMGLEANHDYLLFFAYETSDSNGVFTIVNPHKHRSNDSRFENDGIPVTTHETAPRLLNAKALPTFGDTTCVTVKFDVACDSCKRALVHILIFPAACKSFHSVADTLRLEQLAPSTSNMTVNTTVVNRIADMTCTTPLLQRRVEIEMSEREHNHNDVEEELGGEDVLTTDTNYMVLLASETVGAQGVLSKTFEEPLRVRTHGLAPSFREVRLEPRRGSTTELLLTFSLDRPSEVHFMLGLSNNDEFNVTSPHNISSKGVSDRDRHERDKETPGYGHDVVQTRRSVTYSNGEHIEVLDHLMPGTSYSLFIVSEALPADHGVYGAIQNVENVATFANAPILLAHAAYPTPGSTQALTVGFRMDAPGIVYFSVVAVKPWATAQHVAKGSDRYGNRLALEDELVTLKSLDVDEHSMAFKSDSGWREQILEVPHTGMNYTVHLVTETRGSGGIYGTVATHSGICTHQEAPELLEVSVTPTDACVDTLTISATLRDRGHVHYIALPSDRVSTPRSEPFSHDSTALSGSVDVNETAGDDQKTSFRISGLTQGTSYDLYFRVETFESFGVYGEWTQKAVTARTHGLPPDVLPEAVACEMTPSCAQRGRERCSRKANVCGKCLEGFEAASDEDVSEVNEPCVKLPSAIKAKSRAKIKINGVKRNPNLYSSDEDTELNTENAPELRTEDEAKLVLQTVDSNEEPRGRTTQAIEELKAAQEPTQDESATQDTRQDEATVPVTDDATLQERQLSVENASPVTTSQGGIDDGADALDHSEFKPEQDLISDLQGTCPLNSQPSAIGHCECTSGYEVDDEGTTCVLSRLAPAAKAVTSSAFDMLHAHHQFSSHNT